MKNLKVERFGGEEVGIVRLRAEKTMCSSNSRGKQTNKQTFGKDSALMKGKMTEKRGNLRDVKEIQWACLENKFEYPNRDIG